MDFFVALLLLCGDLGSCFFLSARSVRRVKKGKRPKLKTNTVCELTLMLRSDRKKNKKKLQHFKPTHL